MNRLPRLLFVLALVALAALVGTVSRQRLRSPREVLVETRAALTRSSYDAPLLLRALKSAIRRAEAGDTDSEPARALCADLRLTRAELLMSLGATSDAREDLEVVLERYRLNDPEVRRRLVRVDTEEGDLRGALERLEGIVTEDPDFGPGWVEAGYLHQLLADEIQEEALEELRYVLIADDLAAARERLESLAARRSADPMRTSDMLALRATFPASEEETLARVLEGCDRAAEELELARAAYQRSFQLGFYPRAVRGYLEILIAARRENDAVHFGNMVSALSAQQADAEAARLVIDTLGKKGDWRHAAEIAGEWSRKTSTPLDAEFLRLACYSIYRGERWNFLFGAANRLRSIGSTDDEAASDFYRGVAYASGKTPKPDLALPLLERFARGRAKEPFPGARREAWRQVAEIYRERGDLAREREALAAILAEDDESTGPTWLRLSEIQLQSRHSGYQLPLRSLASAMSRMPRRVEELMPRFEELGRKALEAQSRDVVLIYRNLAQRGLTVPQRDYGPYVLLELAKLYGEDDNRPAQAALARRLLDEYAGFLPAHDQLIEAREKSGDRTEFVELVVQRAELAGLDETTLGLLATITQEEYRPGQLVRMMLADTQGTGRVVVANWLYEHGDSQRALDTLKLGSGAKAPRSEHELLLGARIEMEKGRYREALQWLSLLPEEGGRVRERRLRTLICALQTGQVDVLREVTLELLSQEAPSAEELLKLIDTFLRLGELRGVEQLLAGLAGRSDLPQGALHLRRAVSRLAERQLDEAEDEVDLAEPFLAPDEAAALRLLVAGRRHDWIACERIAAEALEEDPTDDPELAALFFLLSGREAEALELADFAVELAPQSLVWTLTGAIARLRLGEPLTLPPDFGRTGKGQLARFLGAGSNSTSDAREVVTWLLAAEVESLRPYLQAELRAVDVKERGKLWPRLLEATLLIEMGYAGEAEPLLRSLTGTFSDCLPVWQHLERAVVERLGSPDHPQVLALREARLMRVARAFPDGPEALLLEGRIAQREGDLARALRLTEEALRERPRWNPARLQMAELLTATRNWSEARELWTAIAHQDDSELGRRAVAGFIDMLELASEGAAEELSREEHIALLNQLVQWHPTDPRPVLALAELDLGFDPSNPTLGVGRALNRLERFRQSYAEVSLEELQRGSTQRWARFYVEVDPNAAEGFLRAELELQPGDTELWGLLGRVLRELGRTQESLEFLARASRMTPDPALQLELARTLVETGAEPRQLAGVLRRARVGAGSEEPLEATLLRTESMLNQRAPGAWKAAAEALTPLWGDRASLALPEQRARLAALYGRALLMRNEPGDAAAAAQALQAQLPDAEPVYQRELMTVWIGIARSQAKRPAAEARESL